MGWIYLVESEESASHLETMSDQSPIAKLTPIVKQSSYLECIPDTFQELKYGMTSKPLSQENSEPSTLLSAASRNYVKTLVLQEMEKAWQESEADCFSRSCAWPKKSSPSSYSLKTSQQLRAEGDFELLEKLPRWGMIVDGVLYPLKALEQCTKEKDGFYWPATKAIAYLTYATPCASQANKPIREPSPSRQKKEHGEDIQDSVGRLNPSSIGKKLCPKWVSVLMGFPITWLDLDPSVMLWYHNKLKRRSKS